MSYHHLSRKERGKLALLEANHIPIREVARQLGRNTSTISRELRRNSQENGRYRADPAQARAVLRHQKSCRRPLYEQVAVSGYVREKLLCCWSPEQISGRIRLDFPDDPTMRVAHSSIYRWLHAGLLYQAADLRPNLRHYGHQHGEKRGKFNGARELKTRSKKALRRQRLGDWEVDTIVSCERTDTSCVLTSCDRKSRACRLVLHKNKTKPEAMRGFHVLFDAPGVPLETITGDRGTEFACYPEVEEQLKTPFYFTRPRSPWQKPSVENLNGLIRQFFPKGTNFEEISPEQVSKVMDALNNRPRKCLGFLTPNEVLHFT